MQLTLILLIFSPLFCTSKTLRYDQNKLNIPPRPLSTLPVNKDLSDLIESQLNLTADPCNDFYNYVCGHFQGQGIADDLWPENTRKFLEFLTAISKRDPKPAQLEKNYYKKCIQALHDPNLNAKAKLPHQIIIGLERASGVQFPLARGNNPTSINPTQMGKAFGYLNRISSDFSPFIKIGIENNMIDSNLSFVLRYSFNNDLDFVSQFNGSKELMVNNIYNTLSTYFNATGTNVNNSAILTEAQNIADLEFILANLTFDNNDRIMFLSTKVLAEALSEFIDIPSLYAELTDGLDEIRGLILDPNYINHLSEVFVGNMDTFLKILNTTSSISVDTTIWNYIFYHVIRKKSDYMPGTVPRPINPTLKAKFPRTFYPTKEFESNNVELTCLSFLPAKWEKINNWIFLLALYPDDNEIESFQRDLSQMTEEIILAYRAMFEQTSWLNEESRKNVNYKLDYMIRNILYTAETFNRDYLLKYYKTLNITKQMDFLDMQLELDRFNRRNNILTLNLKNYRTGFLDTSEINAAYNPYENSINILAGLAQSPIYHPDYPDAYKYGAYGNTLGHEIGHAFDNSGVNFNWLGKFDPVLDNETQVEFDKTAQCLVNEYNKFCLDKNHCVNGNLTLGENLADNAGLEATYRAYRAHTDLHGGDDLLPGQIVSQFTDDQLFFIGFGASWCTNKTKFPDPRNWNDPHTPSFLRPLGSIQNFEAFRVAFNCPVGSSYAPKEENTCKVWITDVEPREVPSFK